MTTPPISSKEKKLRSLRKILWIVFSAIAITILLVSSLSLPAALLINKTSSIASLFANLAKGFSLPTAADTGIT